MARFHGAVGTEPTGTTYSVRPPAVANVTTTPMDIPTVADYLCRPLGLAYE
jgi:hypothetical protein